MTLDDFLDMKLSEDEAVEVQLISDKTQKFIDSFKVTIKDGKRTYDTEDRLELARNLMVDVVGWYDGNPLVVYLEY